MQLISSAQQKSDRLSQIANQLKSELIGIDHIVDRLIDAVKPWYINANLQNSPLIINLWGMTGVGKTTLVNRFLELALVDQAIPKIAFNMGDKRFAEDILDQLEHLEKSADDRAVLIFDEFQHAKTLDEDAKDQERPFSRLIWPLLDEGYFYYMPFRYEKPVIYDWLNGLKICLRKGVEIQNGKVIANIDTYAQIMDVDSFHLKTENPSFFKDIQVNHLYELCKDRFRFKTDLKAHLTELNGPELQQFLEEVSLTCTSPRKVDLRKSLIFIMANLDEAYGMSYSMSAEVDADEFYQESRQVNFNAVKEVLKSYFRLEEIARLGNIHLIYPALRGDVFLNYIDQELKKIALKYQKTYEAFFEFDSSVNEMLYREGVVPAQGLRPLKSTIRHLLEPTLLSFIGTHHTVSQQKYLISVAGKEIAFFLEGKRVFTKTVFMPVSESKLIPVDSETKAVIALHESAHALVFMMCFGELPQKVTIKSSDWGVGGYVRTKSTVGPLSLIKLRAETKVRLAGVVAEGLIFGDQYVTNGSAADLHAASSSLMKAASQGGFAGRNAFFEHAYQGRGRSLPIDEQITGWVENELNEAKDAVLCILKSERHILAMLTEALLDQEELGHTELKKLFADKEIDLRQFLSSKRICTPYIEQITKFIQSEKQATENYSVCLQ